MDNIREKLVELIGDCKWYMPLEELADHLIANGVTVVQQPQTNEEALRAISGEALAAFITRRWVLCVDVCECCEHSVWDIMKGRHCAVGGACPPVVYEKALKAWMQKPFVMSLRWVYPPTPPKGVSEEALPVADEATERSVAVEKTEDQRKPEGFIGHRKLEVSG